MLLILFRLEHYTGLTFTKHINIYKIISQIVISFVFSSRLETLPQLFPITSRPINRPDNVGIQWVLEYPLRLG